MGSLAFRHTTTAPKNLSHEHTATKSSTVFYLSLSASAAPSKGLSKGLVGLLLPHHHLHPKTRVASTLLPTTTKQTTRPATAASKGLALLFACALALHPLVALFCRRKSGRRLFATSPFAPQNSSHEHTSLPTPNKTGQQGVE
jgi:hypothetical protein